MEGVYIYKKIIERSSDVNFLIDFLQENKEDIIDLEINLIQKIKYNPDYGDDRKCVCGHSYYRHFDSWDDNYPCGCKHCECYIFEEYKENK